MTNPSVEHSSLALEYEQVNENFRMLADIRFKLLALVPTLGGVAVFLLSSVHGAPKAESSEQTLVLLVSLLGLLATLGIVAYDQRNSQLYNALTDRAKYLEVRLQLPGSTAGESGGGQFLERPGPNRQLFGFLLMKHDYGLALVYAPVLGAWLYPISMAVGMLGGAAYPDTVRPATIIAAAGTLVFLEELLRLDGFWRRLRERWLSVRQGKKSPASGIPAT